MSELIPCATCGAHVRVGTCACPHCGGRACASPDARVGDLRTPAAMLLGLALAGCQIPGLKGGDQALYGAVITREDADGDGYFSVETGGDDCDDEDETIHPDAEETPGDGVDSDCDGLDDPAGDTGDTGA